MITEDFVSFGVAKLMKEKGFNEITQKWYLKYKGEYSLVSKGSAEHTDDSIDVPTLQMAMKWLEEKYGVFCVIRRHGDIDRGFTYSWNWEGRMGLSMKTEGGFVSAKEAREAAIKYFLENLI